MFIRVLIITALIASCGGGKKKKAAAAEGATSGTPTTQTSTSSGGGSSSGASTQGGTSGSTTDTTAPLAPALSSGTSYVAVPATVNLSQNITTDANFKEFRYTTDGTDPTCTTGTVGASVVISSTTTLKVIACDTAGNASPVASATYTAAAQVADVTFSVAAGSYGPAQSVSLSTATGGASIYYTTDGSTPNNTKNLYSSAINVTSTQTIKAIAIKAAMADSNITSAAYTITGDIVTATITGAPTGTNNATSLNVTIGGTNVTEYKYDLVSGTDCTGASYGSWTAVATNITEAPGADGSKILCVLGRDAATNAQNTASTAAWTKDTTGPVISITSPAANTYANASDYTAFAVAGSCDSAGLTINITGPVTTTATCNSGLWSKSLNLTSTSDGAFTVYIDAVDAVGNNATQQTRSFNKDIVAPTATLSGAPTGTNNATTLDVTVGGVGVTEYQYDLVSGTDCTGASYSAWTAVATHITEAPGADGAKILCVIGRDTATNAQATATTASWTKDTSTIGTVSDLAVTGSSNRATLTWSAVSGATGYDLYWKTSSSVSTSDTLVANVTSPYVHIGRTNEQIYYYRLAAKNANGSGSLSNEVSVTPSDDTGLTATTKGSARTSQRQTFYDTVHSRHWMFTKDGSSIKTAYKTATSNWTAATTIALDTLDFSLSYKTISGTGYVFLVAEESSYDISLRRYSVGSTSLTLQTTQTVFDGASVSDRYLYPTVALDDTNVWIAASHGTAHGWSLKVRESSNAATGDLSSWSAAATLGKASAQTKNAILVPAGGEDMQLVLQDGGAVSGYSYTSGSWSAANTGGGYGWLRVAARQGLFAEVNAIAVSGTDIYVGGTAQTGVINLEAIDGNPAASYIARWDGSHWHALGSGLNNTVYAIAISGSNVYVGGVFTDAGGISDADYIARWDGNAWHALGSSTLTAGVQSIAVSGTDVYVGGLFTDAGGDANMDYIAKWNGSAWSALGSGLNNNVFSIAVSSSNVYVGGVFTNAGGVAAADSLAVWNGSAWSALGAWSVAEASNVRSILISGSNVYVGGSFPDAAGITMADNVAKWNGSAWSAVGIGISSGQIYQLALHGGLLHAVGTFTNANGDAAADGLARFDGTSSWEAVGTGLTVGANGAASLVSSGTTLYVGGKDKVFTVSGGAMAGGLASFDGSTWSNVSGSYGDYHNATSNGYVYAAQVSGNNLYLGGSFTDAFGIADADYVVKWNGSAWSAMGAASLNAAVRSIAVIDDNNVYVGGDFTNVGGTAAIDYIAKWDSSANSGSGGWSQVGAVTALGAVKALALSGTTLYIGGSFINLGNTSGDYITRFNTSNSTWSSMGTGANGAVNAISISGTDVYAGGAFTLAGGVANTNRVAKWNGSAWSALSTGRSADVSAVAVSGSNVYVGGSGFTSDSAVAVFDGSSWTTLGTGVYPVYGLAVVGSDLYAGGLFTDAGGVSGANYIARWNGSSWQKALDTPFGLTYSLTNVTDGSETHLYAGTTRDLMVMKPMIAGDVTGLSAVGDGTAHGTRIVYTTKGGTALTRIFSAGSWSAATTLATATVYNPVVSYDSGSGDYFAIWNQNDGTNYKRFDGSSWDVSATAIYAQGTRPVCDDISAGGVIKCLFATGNSSPFTLRMGLIGP